MLSIRPGQSASDSVYNFAGETFIPEYLAILAKATQLGYDLPTPQVQVLQNALISALKSDGTWDKLDHFKVYAGSNQDFALLNWINPSTFQSTRVNSPTYGYSYGFKGNATNARLTTGFTPSGLLNYKQDDACYFRYKKTENTIGQTQNYMGAYDGTKNALFGTYGNNFDVALNNVSTPPFTAGSNSIGMNILNRSSAANYKVYMNKTDIQTVTATSSGIPVIEFWTCMIQVTASSDAEYSCEGAGASLTTGQIATLTDSFDTYLTAL